MKFALHEVCDVIVNDYNSPEGWLKVLKKKLLFYATMADN